jgi:hypothetical protein
MVEFFERMPHGQLLPHIKDCLHFDSQGQNYYPVIYMNEFWTLRDHMLLLNESVRDIPLNVTFEPLSAWVISLHNENHLLTFEHRNGI